MIVLINTFKNMIVKFVGGCSVATRSYMIIYSVSKMYSFASVCGKPLQELQDKKYKTYYDN